MTEQHWLEHQVHTNQNDDDEEEDKHFIFHLFDQNTKEENKYQVMNFEFPNVPKITIESQTECASSTGLALWIGSEMLGEFLSKHSEVVAGKDVLELGAGVGLCGILSHHLGASKVVLTDGDVSVLKILQRNIQTNISKNGANVSCRQLIWGYPKVEEREHFQEMQVKANELFQVIMAADCLYMKTSVKPLFETVDHYLSNDGVLVYIMVSASQSPLEYVLEIATSFGFMWEAQESSVYFFRRK